MGLNPAADPPLQLILSKERESLVLEFTPDFFMLNNFMFFLIIKFYSSTVFNFIIIIIIKCAHVNKIKNPS